VLQQVVLVFPQQLVEMFGFLKLPLQVVVEPVVYDLRGA